MSDSTELVEVSSLRLSGDSCGLALDYLPLNLDDGKRDSVGGYAVSHDPYAVRAGGCVLPDEVRLAVTVEVLRNPSAWRGRGGQQAKDADRICRADEHFTVADCWRDEFVSLAKLVALRDLIAVVEFG